MINKKRGGLYNTLTSLIIFGIMLVAVFFLVRGIASDNNYQNDKSLVLLKNTIQNISGAPLREKSITLDLDKDVAIIGFNKGLDSHFQYMFDEFDADKVDHTFFMKGFFMERPSKCNIDMACLCLCRGYSYVRKTDSVFTTMHDAHIYCEKELSCIALHEDIEFRQMKMPQVFDDSLKRIVTTQDYLPGRENHYWNNGFIILRTEKIDNTKNEEYVTKTTVTVRGTTHIKISHPLVISGYQDYSPLRFIDTKVYTDSNGKIGICLKSQCNITSFN